MTPPMSFERYRQVSATLPEPSPAQMQAFARHVVKSHSWYKKLPLLPPGLPFVFFLDPGAGMSRVVREDQLLGVRSRGKDDLHHYAWLETDKHRALFGHLAYGVLPAATTSSQATSPPATAVGGDAPPEGATRLSAGTHDGGPTLLDPGLGHDVLLPREAWAAIAQVSGLIHDVAFDSPFYLSKMLAPGIQWPAESGGPAALAEIQTRCQQLIDGADRVPAPDTARDWSRPISLFGDSLLDRLVEPERQRQLNGMVSAMKRAVALVAG